MRTEHSNPVHLIFFADRAVLLGLHGALGSLIGHLNAKRTAKISVYYENLSPRDLRRLQETVRIAHSRADREQPAPILHLEPVFSLPHDGLRPNVGSVLPYCKLFVPTVLPKSGRACVLDCDILVEDDISVLFDFPLDGMAIGCGIESILSCSKEKDFWAAQGRPGYESYYNTGVMLFDLDYYWKADLLEITSAFLAKNKDACLTVDQTAFNAVLYPYVKPLEPRWNKIVFPSVRSGRAGLPGITHFAENPKPFDLGARLVSPNGRVFTRSLRDWTGLSWWPLPVRYNAARLGRAWKIRRRYLGLIRARLNGWLRRIFCPPSKPARGATM